MSCPFHSVPPICDLPFILSNSIFPLFFSYFCASLPLSPPDHDLQMTAFLTLRKCCRYMQRHSAVHGLCLTLCGIVSKRIALIHLHLEAMRFQHTRSFLSVRSRDTCFCTRPSNCKLLLLNLAAGSERRLSCRRYRNPRGGYVHWSYVLSVFLLRILTPPLLQ